MTPMIRLQTLCFFVLLCGCATAPQPNNDAAAADVVDAASSDVVDNDGEGPNAALQRSLSRGVWSRMHPTLPLVYRLQFNISLATRERDFQLPGGCHDVTTLRGYFSAQAGLLISVHFETGTTETRGCNNPADNRAPTAIPMDAPPMSDFGAEARITGDTLTLTHNMMDEVWTR